MPYFKVDPENEPKLPPEPLVYSPEQGGIIDADGNIAVMGEMTNVTGKRLAACYNACAGIPTEILKQKQFSYAALMARLMPDTLEETLRVTKEAIDKYSVKEAPDG